MCLVCTAASAQSGLRSASLPDRTPMNPIPPPAVDQFVATPRTYTPRSAPRPRHHRRYEYPIGYGYAGGYYYPEPESTRFEESQPNGYLYLQLEPSTAEVRVDGFYVGTVNDVRRLIPGRSLEAGPHRIELSAPGYATTGFDVLVQPSETITYRTDLEPLPERRVAAAAVARAVPKTFYVIPGCYAGDKPPKNRPLPRGCSASKMRVIPPSVSTIARAR